MTHTKEEALKLAQPAQEPVAENFMDALKFDVAARDAREWDALYTTTPAQPAPVQELQKQLRGALSSLDFYRRRVEVLQQWQSKMRDPERTIVCDIIANGHTLDPAGDRYTPPAAPAAQRKPLTDEWIHRTTVLMGFNPEWTTEIGIAHAIVRAAEAAHGIKEKNT